MVLPIVVAITAVHTATGETVLAATASSSREGAARHFSVVTEGGRCILVLVGKRGVLREEGREPMSFHYDSTDGAVALDSD